MKRERAEGLARHEDEKKAYEKLGFEDRMRADETRRSMERLDKYCNLYIKPIPIGTAALYSGIIEILEWAKSLGYQLPSRSNHISPLHAVCNSISELQLWILQIQEHLHGRQQSLV